MGRRMLLNGARLWILQRKCAPRTHGQYFKIRRSAVGGNFTPVAAENIGLLFARMFMPRSLGDFGYLVLYTRGGASGAVRPPAEPGDEELPEF
jgi:hypothetical protein